MWRATAKCFRGYGDVMNQQRASILTLLAVTALTLASLLVADGTHSTSIVHAGGTIPWEYKGATMPSWSENELYNSGPALQQLAKAGANSVTFVAVWYAPNSASADMYRTGNTASDASLISAIQQAQSLGLKVILKPHLDSQDGAWRAYINPSNPDLWFTNYAAMINHYADLGQQQGAVALCVGTELVSMSTNPAYESRWRSLVAGVRARFGGKLTYSANWGSEGFAEEFSRIPFWDALDYLGLSAYFPVASTNTPTVDQMRASWANWQTTKINPFQQRWGKPVLFTEGGYRSADGTATTPYDWSSTQTLDTQEQVDSYEALYQSWAGVSWFAGQMFWDWSTSANVSPTDTGYEVQNKPAYNTVSAWFGGPPSAPTITIAPTSAVSSSTATVSWTTNQTASTHVDYGFTTTYSLAADGPGGVTAHAVTLNNLTSGKTYYFKVTSTNANGTATATGQFTTASANCPVGQYRAEYFSNTTLSGPATTTQCETAINYDWGTGGPTTGVGVDNFSARWTGQFSFSAGSYTFTARADDGVRVYLDGTLIIDSWSDHGPTTYTANRMLTASTHEVKVEYYEHTGGAVAQVSW